MSVLLALMIMGGLAAIVISAESGSTSKGDSKSDGAGLTLKTSPSNAAPDISAAAAVACKTNYLTAMQAVSYFETLNGRPPRSTADLSSILKDPLDSSYFTISIDPARAGQVDVATHGHPASAGDANCAFAG